MSLKAVHIMFVMVSTILCGGFGLWAFRAYRDEQGVAFLVAGAVSWALVVALFIYGRWFLKKLEGVSYL
jgi:hypothetical protein